MACNSDKFPSNINSSVTENHFRIKETKLFVQTPAEYTFFEGENKFVHSDSSYIQCMIVPSNFYQTLENDQHDFLLNKDYEIVKEQRFTINDLPGIYFELKEGDLSYLYFMYGDSLVENRIIAVQAKGSDHRNTIFDFVANSTYQASIDIEPMESAMFKINLSDIGFQYYSSLMNQYVFIEEDFQKYYDNNEQANFVSISQHNRGTEREDIDEFLEIMLSNMVKQGILLKETLFSDTLSVDDNYARATAISAEYDNKHLVLYMLTTGRDGTIVHIAGNLNHSGLSLVPKIHGQASEMEIFESN